MIIGVLVCGILAYALFDIGRTLVRRIRGSAARAAAETRPFEARTPEEHAAAWANELETVEAILGAEALWTEADQEWLESRRISLPT